MKLGRFLLKSDHDILFHCHVGEEHRLLRNHIYTASKCNGRFRQMHFFTFHINSAVIRLIDTHDDLHQRTLTSAVTANQRKHLAFLQFQIDSLQNLIETECFADALDRQQ